MGQNLHVYYSSIKICEAVDCYDAATEEVKISAGKFGTISLNLCHQCAVIKFGAEMNRKEQNRRNEDMEVAQRKHKVFNLIIEQLISALDELASNKVH